MSSSLVVCPSCKRRTRGLTCQHCGSPLPAPQPEPAPAAAAAPEVRSGQFLVTSAGESIPLEHGKPFLLGRSTDADLVARSTDVSRQHAQVIWGREHSGPLVQDLDARHGTFVNGKRLEPHSVRPLKHGDRVRLASNTVFLYFNIDPNSLREEIDAHGVGQLTSEFAVKDIEKRKETRRVARLQRPPAASTPPLRRLPTKGDLRATPGSQLLALCKEHAFTGRIEFFDGIRRGHIEVLGGTPSRGVMARTPSDEVMEVFTGLRQGTYHLDQECPHVGSFTLLPANDVLVELYEQKVTGVLNLFREDAPETLSGRLCLVDGVVRSAGFARLVSVAALEHVGGLTEGRFAFEERTRDELDGRLSTPRGKRETIAMRTPQPPLPERE